jgi:hypothetical protein
MITNCQEVAKYAIACGVDRIFIDLEIIGKHSRQGHLSTVISDHSISDIKRLRSVVPSDCLMVRINPIHQNSLEEIENVIDAGADMLMLPMYKKLSEVELFARAVDGRAKCCLLVETISATLNLEECIQVPGINEAHIGLNDLHLEHKLKFMFEPFANGMVDKLCVILRKAAIPFGIGGLARHGEGLLPAELILAEHARLGSSRAILSRTFHRMSTTVSEIKEQMDFSIELKKLHDSYNQHMQASPEQLKSHHETVVRLVEEISATINNKTS